MSEREVSSSHFLSKVHHLPRQTPRPWTEQGHTGKKKRRVTKYSRLSQLTSLARYHSRCDLKSIACECKDTDTAFAYSTKRRFQPSRSPTRTFLALPSQYAAAASDYYTSARKVSGKTELTKNGHLFNIVERACGYVSALEPWQPWKIRGLPRSIRCHP